MVDHTANHEYQLFAASEENWEHRSDLQSLEIDVMVRDTDGNRGTYTPHENAMYLATDTGAAYLGDGSSWTSLDIGGEGEIQSHTSNTSNPHDVTASQAGALPDSGGSVSGDVSVSGNASATEVHVGSMLVFDTLASNPSSPPNGSIWFVE